MTNTTKQVLLYEALGAPLPVFAHMPLTLDLKKRKISKRSHGEIVAVQFYRDKGFIPWALCNFLCLLGWNPGTDQEFFSRDELIEAFSLDRISKVNSVFNFRPGDQKFFTDPKLIAMNEHYLRSMEITSLAAMVEPFLKKHDLWHEEYAGSKKDWFLHTLDLIRDRFHTLEDFVTTGRAYFSDTYEFDQKPLKKNVLKHPDLITWMPMLSARFEQLENFDQETAEKTAKELARELDIKPGILLNGMRTVLTGQAAGPSMFDITDALGQKTVVERLQDISHLYPSN
jgi:glutamyl-tRNA synthetase